MNIQHIVLRQIEITHSLLYNVNGFNHIASLLSLLYTNLQVYVRGIFHSAQ
jgi:hypothetical protein